MQAELTTQPKITPDYDAVARFLARLGNDSDPEFKKKENLSALLKDNGEFHPINLPLVPSNSGSPTQYAENIKLMKTKVDEIYALFESKETSLLSSFKADLEQRLELIGISISKNFPTDPTSILDKLSNRKLSVTDYFALPEELAEKVAVARLSYYKPLSEYHYLLTKGNKFFGELEEASKLDLCLSSHGEPERDKMSAVVSVEKNELRFAEYCINNAEVNNYGKISAAVKGLIKLAGTDLYNTVLEIISSLSSPKEKETKTGQIFKAVYEYANTEAITRFTASLLYSAAPILDTFCADFAFTPPD